LSFRGAQPLAAPVGVLVFGLPYQLMELHRTIADEPNVQFVLKPVKPSDLLRAVTRLANITAAPHEKVVAGDADWLHDSLGGDPFAGRPRGPTRGGRSERRAEHHRRDASERARRYDERRARGACAP
jgi:hypothetical protein